MEQRFDLTKETLLSKAKQYARNGRIGNFEDAACLNESTNAQACWWFVTKHIIALKDYILEPDDVPMEQWEEKIGDIICYMFLLEAIVKEGD